jgi:hypothetical protein
MGWSTLAWWICCRSTCLRGAAVGPVERLWSAVEGTARSPRTAGRRAGLRPTGAGSADSPKTIRARLELVAGGRWWAHRGRSTWWRWGWDRRQSDEVGVPAWAFAFIVLVLLSLFRRPLLWTAGRGFEGRLVVDGAILVAFLAFVGLAWQSLAGVPASTRALDVCMKPDGTPVTNNLGCPNTFVYSPPPEIDASTWGQGWTR